MRPVLAVLAVALLGSSIATRVLREDTTHFGPIVPSAESLSSYLRDHLRQPIEPTDSMSEAVFKLAGAASDFAKHVDASMVEADDDGVSLLRGNAGPKRVRTESDEYPYWRFIPDLAARLIVDGPAVQWTGFCFSESSAKATTSGNNTITISITLSKAKSLICSDSFLISDVTQISLHTFTSHGNKTLTWTFSNYTSAELWDMKTNGLRVFMFLDSIEEITKSVADTALLFEPLATKAVSEAAASRNMDFLSKYANIKTMHKRNITDVHLDTSEIHSGDFFGVVRLDGLDPLLGWAMGSTTGHTTVALRDGDNVFVCESTAKSSYWDVNGIQCTPYEEWVTKAKAASYAVVHLPLAPKYRDSFNETAAWEFFHSVEGLDYGYETLLWGWVDTIKDNYPCIPPDWSRCLTYDIIEILFPIGSKIVPQFTMLWQQAYNHRLGTTNLVWAELLQYASQHNVVANTIPTIVEQDSWVYNILRNGQPSSGPSMVCCVFVCNIWKASGMFGDLGNQINCGELTNWDDYSMLVFDSDYQRPQACVDADPDNAACQILGEYSLYLNNYNTKAPYAHMAESCPSLPPSYSKPDTC